MKLFAIGDLHLAMSVSKPMDVFGAMWQNHTEKIESAWRDKVSEEDVVLIPGDISWAKRLDEAKTDLSWLEHLPGRKICIRGNHDYWWDRPGKLNATFERIYFLQHTTVKIGGLAICGTRGWMSPNEVNFTDEDERLYAREVMRLELSLKKAVKENAEEIWVLLHYPPTLNKNFSSPLITLMKKYPVTRVIYGHLHDPISWQEAPIGSYEGMRYHLVAADYLGFEPLLIEERLNK